MPVTTTALTRTRIGGIVLLLVAATAFGCAQTQNPSLSISHAASRAALRDMAARPVTLDRPVVVLGGFLDPLFTPAVLVPKIKHTTGDTRVIGITYPLAWDFDDCRADVISALEKHYPSDDPNWTTEVDVIGMSMGGVVARHAAAPHRDGGKRLRIARLFTISTPHRGANLAHLPPINRLMHDMKPGSQFMRGLHRDLAEARYELHPYVRLSDLVVGPENAAPPGEVPWWVSAVPLQMSHGFAILDTRIVADIARRLRGETPFATTPRAPLPGTSDEPDAEAAVSRLTRIH